MKVVSAIKKLAKFGKVEKCGGQYSAIINSNEVSFRVNGREDEDSSICVIYVRPVHMEDDVMTDYFAGTFYRNLTQALKSVNAV